MNLNATKCTFGHSDITSKKQQKRETDAIYVFEKNIVFVIFEHWATK